MNMFIKVIFCLFSLILFASCNNEESYNDKVIVSIIKESNTRNFNSIEKGLLDQINLDKLDVHINFYTSDGSDTSAIEIANKVRDDNSTIAIVIGENATLVSMNVIVPQSIIFAGCFDYISLESIKRSKIQNNNILIFTDLYGCTPFNIASKFYRKYSHISLISGMNLDMVIEYFASDVHDDVNKLINDIISVSKDSIVLHSKTFSEIYQDIV